MYRCCHLSDGLNRIPRHLKLDENDALVSHTHDYLFISVRLKDAAAALPDYTVSIKLINQGQVIPGPKWLDWVGQLVAVVDGDDKLSILPKQGAMWTVAELNALAILTGNLVGGPKRLFQMFGCIQWECDLLNFKPLARCNPINILGHRLMNMNLIVPCTYFSFSHLMTVILYIDIISERAANQVYQPSTSAV